MEQLRDKHDVTISAVPEDGKERQEYSMPSINHEAEQHINCLLYTSQNAAKLPVSVRKLPDTSPL